MKRYTDRLKELRVDSDMNQTEIADRLGLKQRTYSNYETGFTDIPTELLIKIAKLYQTSTDYILGITDDPTPPRKSKHKLSS